ncbi:MAG TPA: glycosyltransferase WbuB, partial [Alphaproteobacteria bacterium]
MKPKDKQPSILLINRAYPPVTGATGRLLHDLARHLVRSGYKVTILSTDPKGKSQKSRGPITLSRVKGDDRPSPLGYLGILWRLYRAGVKLPAHDVVVT